MPYAQYLKLDGVEGESTKTDEFQFREALIVEDDMLRSDDIAVSDAPSARPIEYITLNYGDIVGSTVEDANASFETFDFFG